MRILSLFIVLIMLAGCQLEQKEISQKEIAMTCEWILYGRQKESFIFNLDKNEVYWVNENKRYPIIEINEGRIVFQGVRSSLLVGDKKSISGVPIEFTINRVTGELYPKIVGIEIPSGYSNINICVATKKSFE